MNRSWRMKRNTVTPSKPFDVSDVRRMSLDVPAQPIVHAPEPSSKKRFETAPGN